MKELNFARGNSKLGKNVVVFNLPAGHHCPFAKDCLSYSDRNTGKITDGKHTKFRCYAASEEARHPNVRASRWHNYQTLKNAGKDANSIADIIIRNLPSRSNIIRIHSSGDFFHQEYFDAWLLVASHFPDKLFYSYTKSIRYWLTRKNDIPENFILTASFGGKEDHLILHNNLRYSKVVNSVEEADSLSLELDHNDLLAQKSGNSFALLIHGTQPKGSLEAKASHRNRISGLTGYKAYKQTLQLQ